MEINLKDLTIAVLPFVNMSTSEENEYFSDGITEEIINALAQIGHLKVTSRTSSFFFKNKNIPITEIGNKLNVSTILEGSIRLAGKQMRITAQLIDVADVVIEGEKTGALGLAYLLKKDARNASKYLEKLRVQAKEVFGYTADSYLFMMSAVSGETDKAFEIYRSPGSSNKK